MNIAYYSHYFVPEIGAPSARIHDLSREWLRAGDAVQVVTCFPNHPTGTLYPGYRKRFYQHELLDGIDVHRVWSYIAPNKGFVKKTIGHVSFHPAAIVASRLKMKTTPDVFIGTSPTFFAAMAADHVARARKRPFIMEVRDLWPALFVELGILKNRYAIAALEKLELSLYRKATRVVAVTEAFRQNLIDRGVPDWKVRTIPNGADVDFWTERGEGRALRQRLGFDSQFVALYIGAHGISQGLTSVIDAATRLRDRRDIRFVFVGEGADKEKLVAHVARENLSNVSFFEPVGKEEVRAFYSMSDACLVPLRDIPLFETFIPSKMFEILSMERPIVGAVKGEAARILDDSGGAIVVAPENAEALANGIERLASLSVEERASMGARGRQFVIDRFSRRALAATYREVMNDAIADYKKGRR